MTMSNMMEKLISDSTEDQLCASLPTPNAALLRATLRLSGTACHSDHSFFFWFAIIYVVGRNHFQKQR